MERTLQPLVYFDVRFRTQTLILGARPDACVENILNMALDQSKFNKIPQRRFLHLAVAPYGPLLNDRLPVSSLPKNRRLFGSLGNMKCENPRCIALNEYNSLAMRFYDFGVSKCIIISRRTLHDKKPITIRTMMRILNFTYCMQSAKSVHPWNATFVFVLLRHMADRVKCIQTLAPALSTNSPAR